MQTSNTAVYATRNLSKMHIELSDFGLISKCESGNPRMDSQMKFCPIFTFIHDQDLVKFVSACKRVSGTSLNHSIHSELCDKVRTPKTDQLEQINSKDKTSLSISVRIRFRSIENTDKLNIDEIQSVDIQSTEINGQNGLLILNQDYRSVDVKISFVNHSIHLEISPIVESRWKRILVGRILRNGLGGLLNCFWLVLFWHLMRKKSLEP